MPRDTHLPGHLAARLDLVVRLADAFEAGTHDPGIWSECSRYGVTYTSICSDAVKVYRWRKLPWYRRIWSNPLNDYEV